MKSFLTEVVRGRDADYVEVRVQETEELRIRFQGPKLEQIGQAVNFGGNVRALVNGGWGFVSFNTLEGLESAVEAAIKQARIIGNVLGEKSCLAPVPAVVDEVPLVAISDPRAVSLEAKKSLLESYNRQILEFGPPVVSSVVNYFDSYTRAYFANSEGTYITQEKMDLGGHLVAIASRDGQSQQQIVSFGSSNSFNVVKGLERKVDEACRNAVAMLDAPAVAAGQYTVILDPMLAGVFIHEAFGHLSEADFVYENKNLQNIMQLGTRFGGTHLNVFDTGLEPGARGYLKYDDEGVPTEKTYLIREGLLVGRLHTRETAGKMNERPTGNARAVDYRFPPICRMRNTCIEKGDASFSDMLKGVKLGIYAIGDYGGQTNGEMFTFGAGRAYMIRDGRIAEMVKDVNLTGNVFTTLGNIDLVGSDYTPFEDGGGCGKGGQWPLPTSMWSPHIRIRDVVAGGKN